MRTFAKNKMKRKFYPACLIIGLLFSSCIKEDLTDCQPVLRVVFTGEDETIDPDNLQKASLFIFNENDEFVTSYSIDNPLLNTIYQPDVKLAPGKYNFVVWFNLLSLYSAFPAPDNSQTEKVVRSQAGISLQLPENRIIDETQTTLLPLLYGSLNDATLHSTGENIFTIPLNQNTNTIRLTLSGLVATRDDYRFTITDNNGNYQFNDDFAPCENFSYSTLGTFHAESNTVTASLVVLKLSENRLNPLLTIRNQTTGDQIFPSSGWMNNNLIQLIQARYPNNDFNKKHVYDIQISFAADMSITISVDGWNLDLSDHVLLPD
jgi:hypothetical protein